MYKFGSLIFVISFVFGDCSTIPNYIPVCKRSDPKIEECILKAIEVLKPKLMKGIPDLDIPALEPLVIPEIEFSRGSGLRTVCKNLIVRGASNFKVTKLKADINNIHYLVSVTIPSINIDSEYDMDTTILNIKFSGKGKINANATNAKADIVLNGKKVKRDGTIYVEFTSLDIDMKIPDYTVKIDFSNGSANKDLGDAINLAVNENKKEFMAELKPVFEEVLETLFLDVANKITSHFKYDDLFPEK